MRLDYKMKKEWVKLFVAIKNACCTQTELWLSLIFQSRQLLSLCAAMMCPPCVFYFELPELVIGYMLVVRSWLRGTINLILSSMNFVSIIDIAQCGSEPKLTNMRYACHFVVDRMVVFSIP